MDYKQIVTDIFSLKFSSFRTRWFKLIAVIKRKFLFSDNNNFNTEKNSKQIPIIINNRNRVTYLLQLISWLEKSGYNNIYIIDNNSKYPPLLEYYSKTKYPVFRLKENAGH